jgi:hypothetical protein
MRGAEIVYVLTCVIVVIFGIGFIFSLLLIWTDSYGLEDTFVAKHVLFPLLSGGIICFMWIVCLEVVHRPLSFLAFCHDNSQPLLHVVTEM